MTTVSNALYFFDCRVRETRMQFYRSFREPKLYKLAKKFQYEKIVERCQTLPKVAAREAKFQHEYPPQQTALHLVLEPLFLLGNETFVDEDMRKQRHEAAAAILKANPEAAKLCCTFQTSPLTMVCVDPYASLHDLEMLIQASPQSLLMTDLEGRTSLHYACINNRSNLNMIQLLLQSCPEAASVQDRLQRTPLHFEAMANVTSALSAEMYDLTGALVAHSSKAPACSLDVVKLLVGADPSAVCTVDYQNKTPLHHLCRYMRAYSQEENDHDLVSMELIAVLEMLVQTDPSVANQCDDSGCRPMDMIQDLREQLFRAQTGDNGVERAEQGQALDRIISICSSSNNNDYCLRTKEK